MGHNKHTQTIHNMKNISFITILLILFTGCSNRLTPTKAVQKLGPSPYFEVDGVPKNKSDLNTLNASDIASITTYYNKEAKKLYGDKAKDGVVIIETKPYATNKFESFFKSISKEYEEMLNNTGKTDIQYILNDRVLVENYEGTLAAIDNKTFKSIRLIDSSELDSIYQIKEKKVGVIISASRPKELYNSKEKF
jgi:hypothetical protein